MFFIVTAHLALTTALGGLGLGQIYLHPIAGTAVMVPRTADK